MKLRRFCSKCGKIMNNEEKIYPGFLCRACYGKEEIHVHLPQKIQLRKCYICSAVSLRIDDKFLDWQYVPPDELEIDFLSNLLHEALIFSLEDKYSIHCILFLPQSISFDQDSDIHVRIEYQKSDELITGELSLEIQLRKIQCPYCAQKSGGRFDAILQIRIQHPRDIPRLQEILDEIHLIEANEHQKNLSFFITKIENTINGFDLKISNNAMARTLIHQLRTKYPFEVKYSKRLMGIDHETGTRLYRQSTLLRLIPVHKKDHILFDGKDYQVKNITHNKVILIELSGKKVKQLNFDQFQKKKWHFLENESEDQSHFEKKSN
ncbi:MAG: NMD3-related protein [Promethearchaeota archaeon]